MDTTENNLHLEIAQALLNERGLATNICRSFHYAIDSLDAKLMKDLLQEIQNAKYYNGDLRAVRSYVHERLKAVAKLLGVFDYNPDGCTGEQTYKFIQNFTQISLIKTDSPSDTWFYQYTQEEFNNLTE